MAKGKSGMSRIKRYENPGFIVICAPSPVLNQYDWHLNRRLRARLATFGAKNQTRNFSEFPKDITQSRLGQSAVSLSIYLDAINIFLAVLQLMSGRRRD